MKAKNVLLVHRDDKMIIHAFIQKPGIAAPQASTKKESASFSIIIHEVSSRFIHSILKQERLMMGINATQFGIVRCERWSILVFRLNRRTLEKVRSWFSCAVERETPMRQWKLN